MICTTIEQSKKLLDIGIPAESADMRYGYIAPYDYSDRMYDGGYDEVPYPKNFLKDNSTFSADEYDNELPCWSLAALLGMMPSVIKRKEKRMFLTLQKAGTYNLYYKSLDRLDEIWFTKEEAIAAAFEMIIWLKENKYI